MGSKKPHKSSKQERQGMIYVIKKDGTREEFDPQKIVKAVNKSAARILYTFSQEKRILSAVLRRSMQIPSAKTRLRSRKCTIS